MKPAPTTQMRPPFGGGAISKPVSVMLSSLSGRREKLSADPAEHCSYPAPVNIPDAPGRSFHLCEICPSPAPSRRIIRPRRKQDKTLQSINKFPLEPRNNPGTDRTP